MEQEKDLKEVAYGSKVTSLKFYGGWLSSAIPMIFFVVWAIWLCLACSKKGAPDENGLILGAVMGIALGMVMVKGKRADYCQAIFDGMAQPIGVVAIVCWIWAGMFAMVLREGQLVDGLVWLGLQSGCHGAMFTCVTFLLAALFSTAVGTGYGTTVAFCTLMYPAGIILGAHPIVLFGAILSGAAFGDNLAPVSDTTIVSAVSQETDVPGVVRSRFKYAIVAAVPALLLFLTFGSAPQKEIGSVKGVYLFELDSSLQSGLEKNEIGDDVRRAFQAKNKLLSKDATVEKIEDHWLVSDKQQGKQYIISLADKKLQVMLKPRPNGLVLLIPFALVIVLALCGFHIIISISWGILLAVVAIVAFELAPFSAVLSLDLQSDTPGIAGALVTGLGGFVKLSILILFIVASGYIMQIGGALENIKRVILKLVGKRTWGGELAIFSSVFTMNFFITVNTAAEIAAAPFVRDIGKTFKLHPYRRANFLDAVSSALGYIFPWSGGVLIGVYTLRQLGYSIAPTQVYPYVFHGWLLAGVMLFAALSGFGRRFEGPDGKPVKRLES